MYLTEDLIAVQGVLSSVSNKTGELAKIKFKGGNESIILDVVTALHTFLKTKNYINDNFSINPLYQKELDNLVMFLAINTEFKSPGSFDEYSSLTNVISPLSVCILANIIHCLHLYKSCAHAISLLSFPSVIELLEQCEACLRKAKPDDHLFGASVLLEAIIDKLKVSEYSSETEDDIEAVSAVAAVIVQTLGGLNTKFLSDMKKDEIYKHMGFIVEVLLKLILRCKENNNSVEMIRKAITNMCLQLMENVTIDVFCEWADVEENGSILQTRVAETAYKVIEQYKESRELKNLCSMLSAIARKPKTISELISEADITKIIAMVDSHDSDQLLWFRALITSKNVERKEALDCLLRWKHICTADDIVILLRPAVRRHETNETILKCAATLSEDDLFRVVSYYLRGCNNRGPLSENVPPELTPLFNKLEESSADDFGRDWCVCLLRNATATFKYTVTCCMRSSPCAQHLVPLFAKVASFGILEILRPKQVVSEVVMENKLRANSVESYVAFGRMVSSLGFIMFPELWDLLLNLGDTKGNLEDLNVVLQIIVGMDVRIELNEDNIPLIQVIINVEKECRTNFTEFDNLKYESCECCIQILSNLVEIRPESPQIHIETTDDIFTMFYKKSLSNDTPPTLFQHLFADIQGEAHIKLVAHSIRILPRCVATEWLQISLGLLETYRLVQAIEIISDTIILLAQLTNAQINLGKRQLDSAFAHCTRQFGVSVLEMLQKSPGATVEEKRAVARSVFHVLRLLPHELKTELGVHLAGALPREFLQTFVSDRDVLVELVAIADVTICEAIAMKIFDK